MSQKKLVITLLVLMVSAWLYPVPSLGADLNLPEGFVLSDDQGLQVTTEEGYFFKLNELLPGDVISRKLTIRNTSHEPHTLALVIEPISSNGPAQLVKNIEMKVVSEEQVLFTGNLINQDKDNVNLGTTIDFGTIDGASQTSLSLTLKVRADVPWEHFVKDGSQARVRWTFVAERVFEKQPPPKGKGRRLSQLPQTGEHQGWALTCLGISLLSSGWAVARGKLVAPKQRKSRGESAFL